MITYTVTDRRNVQLRGLLAFKDEAQTIEYDFAPWEANNGSVSSVEWTVEKGQAAVSNKTLSSSVAQATITTAQTGASMITLKATAGNNIFKTYLRVVTKDPQQRPYDYGLCDTR